MIVGKTYLLSLIIIRGRFIFEKRGNDTIRAVKSQSDTDFDVKCATIQFHGNNHDSQSYHWIKLKVYIESPNTFSYLGLTFRSIRARKGIAILVNRGCMNFVIYFLLTCELIWLGFFSYKDVAAGFGNFLVLQGYLIGNNIVFMCGMDSILMWNPYGVWKQLFYLYVGIYY